MTCSTGQEKCSYLNSLDGDAVDELRALVRPLGPREAARRMGCSAGHIVNVLAGRRKLFPHLLNRARGSLTERVIISGGYVRVLSAAEWEQIHGRPYPVDEDDDGVPE